MREQQITFLYLIRSGLYGTKASVPLDFDWKHAIEVAKKHQILPILYYGIHNSGIKLEQQIQSEINAYVYRSAAIDCKQSYEAKELKSMFNSKKINFAMLKGAHLKEYFSESVMRSMSDLDIIICPNQIGVAKSLLEAKGYIFVAETDHVIEMTKSDSLFIELHKKLIPSNGSFGLYYENSWKFFHPMKDNSMEYMMSPSDEYVFLFVHFTKHYISGGVGIRQMLDLWLFAEKEKNINYTYVREQFELLGIAEFWKNICDTLKCWMSDFQTTEKIDFITDVIFRNGVFGNHKSYLISTAIKSNKISAIGKMHRISRLFFLPYSGMCVKYPVLKKLPILLPIFWIIRWVESIILHRKRGIKHVKDITNIKSEEIKSTKLAYEYVGIYLDFGSNR